MARDKSKTHPLDQSCLFRVPSKKKLAKSLLASERGLERLANADGKYRSWEAKKKTVA